MAEPRRVGDLLGSRRDLLRIGGLGLLGASVDGVWPLQVSAKQTDAKIQPRGSARNVLFYEMSGAISHVESYDFKETAEFVAAQVKNQDTEPIHLGLFYDPLWEARRKLGEKYDAAELRAALEWLNKSREERKDDSKKLLRLQARDFVTWLRERKAIP